MKNLANCKPSEFLKQTYRIKNSVEKWLNDTDILNIRQKVPELKKITATMTDDEKKAVFEENKKRVNEQVRKNSMAILDAVMDEHAEETLEVLALCCFVEPENVDDYPIDEYLQAFTDIISNQKVVNFFTSLAQLGLNNT